MRTLSNIMCIFFLIFAFGCSEAPVEENLNMESCSNSGEIIKSVSDETGSLRYDEDLNEYSIWQAVDGTYDSVIVGILCSDPGAFELSDKESIKVLFSGTYKEMNENERTGPVGTDFYFLELSEISKIEN